MVKIGVLGAGSWGLGLAMLLQSGQYFQTRLMSLTPHERIKNVFQV